MGDTTAERMGAAAPTSCECNASRATPRRPFCSRSHGGEELFLYGLATALGLPEGEPGVYLEAGGNDGWTTTNTNYLDACMGWRGLLVEPEPRAFSTMRSLRGTALSVHSGVCAAHGRSTLVRRADQRPTGAMVMEDVLNASLGGARRFRPLQWAFSTASAERVDVPCAPLSDILALVGLARIDVLSLDVRAPPHAPSSYKPGTRPPLCLSTSAKHLC